MIDLVKELLKVQLPANRTRIDYEKGQIHVR